MPNENFKIDFTNPTNSYPIEPQVWFPGNPFDVAPFFPSPADRLHMARTDNCAYSSYRIDEDGLILEMQANGATQTFGFFLDRTVTNTVNQIHAKVSFDFVESVERRVRMRAGPHQIVPFIGSVGLVATAADLEDGLLPKDDPKIGATCAFNFDPGTLDTNDEPVTEPSVRPNGPASMYSKPKPTFPFHPYNFLRPNLSHQPKSNLPQFTLEVTATPSSSKTTPATAWMTLTHSEYRPNSSWSVGLPADVFDSSKFNNDFSSIRHGGVTVSITDAGLTWLQPSPGPLRARIRALEFDFWETPPSTAP